MKPPLSPIPDLFDASGAFETCRVRGGRLLYLEEHLKRLMASLKSVGISPLPRRESLAEELKNSARGIRDGFVRAAVRREGSPRLLIHRREGIPYPRELARRGVALRTVPTRWPAGETGPAQAKGSERLAGVLARLEGGDCIEVLRLGPHGYLTEGTASNLFLVGKGRLLTPPPWLGVLEGVTRSRVIQAARSLRIPVEEVPVTRHDLFNAEEAFLTNVLMGILPVRQADGRAIGRGVPGPVTRRLMRKIG